MIFTRKLMLTLKNDFQINRRPICWDAHSCPSFTVGVDLSFLSRYKNSGVNFVSLNVGFDLTNQVETLELIDYFHQWILERNDEYMIVGNVQQIFECQLKNILSVAFDIEGCNLLNGKLDMVSRFYTLGVRQMLFAYNKNNSVGGGCFDVDVGLTQFGKNLIKEFNEVGMVIDCSHVGYQTSMEIIELSKHPIIFSHSNPVRLVNHPRNITDEQIIACAKIGGVIGINGIGIFLGNNDTRTEKIVEHIDYVAQLVGADHVGIGLDCIFSIDEIKSYTKKNPDAFPSKYGFDDVAVAEPEQFLEIKKLLAIRGYSKSEINNILGENFLRIAQTVWK